MEEKESRKNCTASFSTLRSFDVGSCLNLKDQKVPKPVGKVIDFSLTTTKRSWLWDGIFISLTYCNNSLSALVEPSITLPKEYETFMEYRFDTGSHNPNTAHAYVLFWFL